MNINNVYNQLLNKTVGKQTRQHSKANDNRHKNNIRLYKDLELIGYYPHQDCKENECCGYDEIYND